MIDPLLGPTGPNPTYPTLATDPELAYLAQYPNNIVKLLQALVWSAQDIESAYQALLTQRSVDTAVGAQLDVLGKIVGEPRAGLDDDVYRRRVRAKIAVNRSGGVVEDLIRIASLIVFDSAATYVVKREGTATVRLFVSGAIVDADTVTALFALEQLAASAGVRLVVQWGESTPSGWFRFDSGPGFDTGHLTGAEG